MKDIETKAYSDNLGVTLRNSISAQRTAITEVMAALLEPPELPEEELAKWKQDHWGDDVCPIGRAALAVIWSGNSFVCKFKYKSKVPLYYLAERLRSKLIAIESLRIDHIFYNSSCEGWSFSLQLSQEGKILMDQEKILGKAV